MATETPWATVRRRSHPADVVLLALVPLVLGYIYLLPESVARGLAIRYGNPDLVSVVANHFVHLSFEHLATNLLGYVLVVPVGYALALLSDERRTFMSAFVTILVAFPVALSGFNLLFSRPALGLGFSGVLMGYAGLVPVLLVCYLHEHVSPAVTLDWLPALFLVSLGFVVVQNVLVTPVGMRVTALLAGAFVLAMLPVVRSLRAMDVESAPLDFPDALFVGSAVVLFAVVFFANFPADPTRQGFVINIYTHLLGYSLSVLVTYVAVSVGVVPEPERAEDNSPGAPVSSSD